ncbi:hypothetical protein H9P43_008098 [Blastocladiella emersonii ATCC 22665]|nr:hypothetical protein H9P43_008098 [Blastocladiella emersonii ATCC 22665]
MGVFGKKKKSDDSAPSSPTKEVASPKAAASLGDTPKADSDAPPPAPKPKKGDPDYKPGQSYTPKVREGKEAKPKTETSASVTIKASAAMDSPRTGSVSSSGALGEPMPERPTTRCCCLFHMPTSIVLMVVLLLANDVWFAWISMNQRNQAINLYEQMRATWKAQGAMATMRHAQELRTILDANVVVALVDMVFTLVGLAGVDMESFRIFLVFTVWKAIQFCYSVSSSIVTLYLIQYFRGEASSQRAKDLLNWETGISFTGLVLEFYFLILFCIFTHYLRKLRNWKLATSLK